MALTNTTLAADAGANDTVLKLTSTTGYPAVGAVASGNQYRMQVDGEIMYAVRTIATGTVEVRSRGADGTLARPHDVLANVSMGTPEDFITYPDGAEAPRPPYYDEIASYGEDGAITIPNKNTTIFLTKGSAGAYTLGAPTVAQDGLRLTITSQTAFAHVITATGLVGDGATGSPEDILTFAAFIGASCILVASDGLWNVVAGGTAGVVVT
jgi:hypothetical protein